MQGTFRSNGIGTLVHNIYVAYFDASSDPQEKKKKIIACYTYSVSD